MEYSAFDIGETPVAGIENPYVGLDDGDVRRRFATKYSERHVLGREGADLKATLRLLARELDRRDLDAFRALDLHDVPAVTCPECNCLGVHDHPTEGVRSCDECGHCCGEAAFLE